MNGSHCFINQWFTIVLIIYLNVDILLSMRTTVKCIEHSFVFDDALYK